jgi:hypothetical protein
MASQEQVLQALMDAIHHHAQANPSASQLRDLAEAYALLTDEVDDEDDEDDED